MILHVCQQNSEQWEALRRGRPTASEFHRIVKPSEGKSYRCESCEATYPRLRKKCACGGSLQIVMSVRPSDQQDGYIYQLIAESMGVVIERVPNQWMDRGHDLEPAAISEYEFLSGNDTEAVGFCTTDDGLIGASPDRLLVGKRRVVEAKCPSPAVHIRHMVTGDLEDTHKVQVQGQLLVTGYDGADVISYCPGFPSVIIGVDRDEDYIGGMNVILVDFVTRLHRTRAELIAKYGDFRKVQATEVDTLGVSNEDLEAIFAARKV